MSFYKSLVFSLLIVASMNSFAAERQKITAEDVKQHFLQEVKLADLSQEDMDNFILNLDNIQIAEKLTTSQFFIAADRNPKKQNAALVFWDNDNKKTEVIGYTKVSTGSVRDKHFITPTGWFENVTTNGSYRAEGTKNENGIRGLGKKGMRVWDFGWVPATSGFRKNHTIDIRFEMHATDPDLLESRLGRPDSQGCLRIHQSFNKFLDNYGIIDKNYENENYWALSKTRTPALEAGSYVFIFDSNNI
jgi:hypothetical protein